MSGSFWRPSDKQRDAILLLEVAGLLHDLGKLSNGFLKAQDKSTGFPYDYESIADPNRVFPSITSSVSKRFDEMRKNASKPAVEAPFNDRKDITGNLQAHSLQGWDLQSYTLAELLLGQFAARQLAPILLRSFEPARLIRFIHGVAHYEKETPEDRNKQDYASTYSSSPFGSEEHISVDTPGADLTDALIKLPLSKLTVSLAVSARPSSERLKWFAEVEDLLARGIADTQRPTNEVSLWDWGFAVATMTKAAATWIFKNGWSPTFDPKDLPYQTLRINLDILERYSHSDKLTDLLGIRDALDKGFRDVRTLLEETYAFGNRFYHDETGSYYLLPQIFNDDELSDLRRQIQAQFPPDLRPQVHLAEAVTAGELDRDKSLSRKLVANPREQALKEAKDAPVRSDNNLHLFQSEWSPDHRPKNAEICTVCGVRPVGYPRKNSEPEVESQLRNWANQGKAEERNVCRICLDRRGRRAEEWATSGLDGTIWTDEVADDNGRLALFVGKLGLEDWLDGKLLETIKVKDNTTKNPSPARLYRIAETARAFWKHATEKLMPDSVRLRPFRLALYPPDRLDLGDFHVYELEVNGVGLSVVWDKPHGCLVTADNLMYFGKRCGVKEDAFASWLEGRTFELSEPSAFLQPGERLTKVTVERTEILGGYLPAIPILAEPSVCLMLVPADKTLELVRAVKQEYEKEMGRVRDRLPLHVGLIFCHRRTPIRTVLEAGRAMLKLNANDEWEGWRLLKKNSPTTTECELTFDNGITWRIPVVAGDGTTKDEWYPRIYQGDSRSDAQVRHVLDLEVPDLNTSPQQGSKVWVKPSRFDFEFLDVSGRRFEIHYDANGRRPRPTRPFYLEDLDRFGGLWELMKRLAVSQRHQAIHTIEATREMWYGDDQEQRSKHDSVFQQFAADTLAGADWPKSQPWKKIPPEWRERLIKSGIMGELADLAELHMEILKER